MTARLALLLCAMFTLFAAACAGSSPQAVQEIDPAVAVPANGSDTLGLPPVAELDADGRSTSISGPGWHSIDPFVDGGQLFATNASGIGGSLELDASTGNAFVVYPVSGFGADAFPTSLRTDASDDPVGEYFAIAADFRSGRWQVVGPFTDDATIEFPGLAEPGSQRRYVSPSGISYVGLMLAEGDSFNFSKIELGVDGGSSGPRPPVLITMPSGDTELYISWAHSPDHADADFAGYRLERAPQLFGDYEPLNEGLILDSHFIDDTIIQGDGYRYRLAAEDTSGNRSPWMLFQGFSISGSQPVPIIIHKGPSGPLYGPVTVEMDLSESFDPKGVGIQDYYLADPGIGVLANNDGLFSLSLQPGCHFIQFTVATSDMRFATMVTTLKVYPQWESSPTLVADTPAASNARFLYPSMDFGLEGKPTTFAYDTKLRSITMWDPDYGGPNERIDRLPAYWEVDWMTDVADPNWPTLAVSMNKRAWLAAFTYDGNYWVEGPSLLDEDVLELVSVNFNSSYVLCNRSGAVSEDLVAYRLDNLGEELVLAEDLGDIRYISAVARESDQTMFVFVQTATELKWYHFSSFLSTIDSGTIAAGMFGVPRMAEINQQTDRPVLVIEGPFYHWTAMDEMGNWSMPVEIDNTEMNRVGGDTTSSDTVYCCFAYASGQARIYSFNGSGWDVHATMAHSTNSGYPMAMMDAQAGLHGIDMIDTTFDGETHVMRIDDVGNENWHSSYARSAGQGTAMHATSNSAQLHVSWGDLYSAQSVINYSTDNGQNWNQAGPYSGLYWTNGTDSDGNIYYSVNSGTSLLYWWDGANLILQQQVDNGVAECMPSLAGRSINGDMYWNAYNPGTLTMHEYTGKYSTGTPALDYSLATRMPVLRPVWDGTVNDIGYRTRMLARAGGINPKTASLAVYDANSDYYNLIDTNLQAAPADLQSDLLVRSKGLASCSYLGGILFLTDQAFFSTNSSDGRALRCIIDNEQNTSVERFGEQPQPLLRDERRTVSCETLKCYTGLMLMSDVEGRAIDFQWSNFGDWEKLPVPDALAGMGMHEIVEGSDGRWHVFYRDNDSDQVWMLSTI